MSVKKTRNRNKRFNIINSTFPPELPTVYEKTIANTDPYSPANVAEFGKGKRYVNKGKFVPPRSNQFHPQSYDEKNRGYIQFEDEEEWFGIKIPNTPRSSTKPPVEFPKRLEIVTVFGQKYKVLDLYVNEDRKRTGMIRLFKTDSTCFLLSCEVHLRVHLS